jgi:hypothetical protein
MAPVLKLLDDRMDGPFLPLDPNTSSSASTASRKTRPSSTASSLPSPLEPTSSSLKLSLRYRMKPKPRQRFRYLGHRVNAFPLLDLPLEIQNEIFRLVLSDSWDGSAPPLIAALCGNTRSYDSAMAIFRRFNTFSIAHRNMWSIEGMSEMAQKGVENLYFEWRYD